MFALLIMNLSYVLIQLRRMDHLGAERAKFAHIIMNFIDVSCQFVER